MEHVVADVVDHFGSCVCNPPRLPGSSTRPNLCQVNEQMPKVLRRVGMHVEDWLARASPPALCKPPQLLLQFSENGRNRKCLRLEVLDNGLAIRIRLRQLLLVKVTTSRDDERDPAEKKRSNGSGDSQARRRHR